MLYHCDHFAVHLRLILSSVVLPHPVLLLQLCERRDCTSFMHDEDKAIQDMNSQIQTALISLELFVKVLLNTYFHTVVKGHI